MPTKQNVIDRFLRTFPDASSQASSYFDEAYRWVVLNLPIQREAKTIDLVADTWKYDLPAGELLEIEQVLYVTGLDDHNDYEGTILDRQTIPGFTALSDAAIHNLSEGQTVSSYALVSIPNTASGESGEQQIWVWPRYNGTPSGGYPKLVLWGRWYTALDAASRNIPTSIPSIDAIVSKMKQLYLEDYPEGREREAAFFEADAARKLSELQAYHQNRNSQEHMKMIPRVLAQGRRTI